MTYLFIIIEFFEIVSYDPSWSRTHMGPSGGITDVHYHAWSDSFRIKVIIENLGFSGHVT